MLNGPREIILLSVEPVHIHASLYYDITYRTPEGETAERIRINPEAFYPDPRPGDFVEVNFLMGSIMGARKLG